MTVPSMAEGDAYLLFEQLRWGGTPNSCPHCDATVRFYFLRPKDGETRRTRLGGATARRIWRCAICRKQFSVLTGTVFEGTRVSLSTWIAVLAELTSGRPTASADLARRHGITAQTARHVTERLVAAMTAADGTALLANTP